MKALSIHPYPVHLIVEGWKTIEVRTWTTNYRGDLLICSTAKKKRGTIPSHALCVAKIADIVPMKKEHCYDAMMNEKEFEKYKGNLYAWILEDVRLIKPIPIKGKLGLWEYDGEIEYIPQEEYVVPDDTTDEELEELNKKFIEKYWKDIMI